jgi:hypothetical protein
MHELVEVHDAFDVALPVCSLYFAPHACTCLLVVPAFHRCVRPCSMIGDLCFHLINGNGNDKEEKGYVSTYSARRSGFN